MHPRGKFSNFPAESHVQHAENMHPRAKNSKNLLFSLQKLIEAPPGCRFRLGEHAPAKQNFNFPAEVHVHDSESLRPRGKFSVFLLGEHDFLLATCIREPKIQVFPPRCGFRLARTCTREPDFQFFCSANLFRGGECASASRKFKKISIFSSVDYSHSASRHCHSVTNFCTAKSIRISDGRTGFFKIIPSSVRHRDSAT